MTDHPPASPEEPTLPADPELYGLQMRAWEYDAAIQALDASGVGGIFDEFTSLADAVTQLAHFALTHDPESLAPSSPEPAGPPTNTPGLPVPSSQSAPTSSQTRSTAPNA